jgi:hypothetical protein
MAVVREAKNKKVPVQITAEELQPQLVASSRKQPVKTSEILSRTQRGLVEQVYKISPDRFRFDTPEQTLENVGWWAECNLNLNQLAGVMGLTVSELMDLMQESPEIEKAYVTGRERGSAMLYRAVYDMAASGSVEGVGLYLRLHQGTSRNPQNSPHSVERATIRTMPGVFVGFTGEEGPSVVDA